MHLDGSFPQLIHNRIWTLLNGENTDGYTVMEFWRNWVTFDDRDRDIMVIILFYYSLAIS